MIRDNFFETPKINAFQAHLCRIEGKRAIIDSERDRITMYQHKRDRLQYLHDISIAGHSLESNILRRMKRRRADVATRL